MLMELRDTFKEADRIAANHGAAAGQNVAASGAAAKWKTRFSAAKFGVKPFSKGLQGFRDSVPTVFFNPCIAVCFQKKYNGFVEMESITKQLQDALNYDDVVTIRMLVRMRQQEIDNIDMTDRQWAEIADKLSKSAN